MFDWLELLFTRKPRVKSAKALAYEELRAWRPVGGKFWYLGRECVVTGHSESVVHHLGVSWWPELQAEYADDLGVIRALRFTVAEARALMADQLEPVDGR